MQPRSLPTHRYTSMRCYITNSYIGKSVHLLLRQTTYIYTYIYIQKVKVKFSRYWPGVVQRVGRVIDLLFHDRVTRRCDWSAAHPGRTGKEPVPILQEGGWTPGPVWTGGKSRPHRDLIPKHPACNHSLYRLSYPAHIYIYIYIQGYS